MQHYVTGFLFTKDSKRVVLIKKLNPEWQRGLFNGVGGKREADETSLEAITREFKEETGVALDSREWVCFARIHRSGFYDLDVYYAHSDLAFDTKTVEKEEVSLLNVSELPGNMVPNLRWLIPLALDKQADFSNPVLIQEIGIERVEA